MDDIISASADKSPSQASNLVEGRLLLGKMCSRDPSAKRLRVGLLLLAAPANRARANHTGDFTPKKSKRAAPSEPPPIAIPSSPLLPAPL